MPVTVRPKGTQRRHAPGQDSIVPGEGRIPSGLVEELGSVGRGTVRKIATRRRFVIRSLHGPYDRT